MHAHGGAAGQGGVLQIVRHTQLVEGMAAFMDDAVHAGGDIILMIMGGDAHIPLVGAAGEGVLGLADGAALWIQALEGHDPVGEQALLGDGIGVTHEGWNGQGMGRHFGDQGRKLLPQGREEGIQIRHAGALFIQIEEHVISGLLRIPQGRIPAAGGDQLFQVGGEGGKIRLLLRFMPDSAGFVHQTGIGDIFIQGKHMHVIVIFLQELRPAEGFFIHLIPGGQDHGEHFTGGFADHLLIGELAEVADGLPAGAPGLLRRYGLPVHIEDILGMVEGIGGFFQPVQLCYSLFKRHRCILLIDFSGSAGSYLFSSCLAGIFRYCRDSLSQIRGNGHFLSQFFSGLRGKMAVSVENQGERRKMEKLKKGLYNRGELWYYIAC